MDHIGGMNIRKYQLFWLIRVPWELPELRGGFVGFSGDWCHPLEYIRVIPCQSILWLLISNMLYCQPYLGWLFPCLYVFRLETCWNHQTSMVPCVTLRYTTQLPGKEKKVWGKSAPWHRKGRPSALSFEFQACFEFQKTASLRWLYLQHVSELKSNKERRSSG